MISLNVKNEQGKVEEYISDLEIIRGLYLTHNLEKVILNSKIFNIPLDKQIGKVATKIKNIKNISIVTIEISKNKKFQYFVGNDLELEELVKIPNNKMPNNIKEVILKAYHLIQKSHLIPNIQAN